MTLPLDSPVSSTLPLFQVALHVAYRENVLHPESKTLTETLHHMGYGQVQAVKAGRYFELTLGAEDDDAASKLALEMAEKLLANPVIEDWKILELRQLAPRVEA